MRENRKAPNQRTGFQQRRKAALRSGAAILTLAASGLTGSRRSPQPESPPSLWHKIETLSTENGRDPEMGKNGAGLKEQNFGRKKKSRPKNLTLCGAKGHRGQNIEELAPNRGWRLGPGSRLTTQIRSMNDLFSRLQPGLFLLETYPVTLGDSSHKIRKDGTMTQGRGKRIRLPAGDKSHPL